MLDVKKLKAIREKKGLSGAGLARLVGISPQHYNNLERNAKSVSLNTLSAICQALDIEVADIWDMSENLPPILPVHSDDVIIVERSTTKFIFPNTPETYQYISGLVAEKDSIIDPVFQTVIEKWNKATPETMAKILALLQEETDK